MKTKDPITQYCWDWVRWCETRHFYIRSVGQGTLGALQQGKGTGREPNARNDPDMQYFNMAVHTLRDIAKYKTEWAAFEYFYLKSDQVVKRTAADLGVGLRTYYDLVRRFERRAYKLYPVLKKTHEEMMAATAKQAALAVEDID
ncbi:hypothetical protein [Massilia sp. TSP1-1-2]|uniref:hypothetical protein n=1 Tax=Massilia sp. TSP1-1-2 TaxID=2804649 RepID=UPI003CE6E785